MRSRRAGADVFDLDLPEFFDELEQAHRVICGFEAVRNYSDELRRWPELVSNDFKRERVQVGNASTLGDFRDSLRLGFRARAWMDKTIVERGIDAILTPSAPGEAPHGLSLDRHGGSELSWTHLYMPAVTLPHFTGPNGLPVGVQLVGRRYEDDRHLTFAAWTDRVLSGLGDEMRQP